ncbi:MAG: carboxypeptidase-like regulatory domain-containing protein, partial [Bacteroidota bacterium]
MSYCRLLLKKTNMIGLTACAVVMMTGILSAQTAGKIAGAIMDAETGEPIIGCNILIMGTSMGAITDIEGSYYILNVPPGKYDVQASMIGYQKVQMKDVIVNSGKTTTLDFKITQASVVTDVV